MSNKLKKNLFKGDLKLFKIIKVLLLHKLIGLVGGIKTLLKYLTSKELIQLNIFYKQCMNIIKQNKHQ